MKKYILFASIAIIAVLNFTLVKSKTGEVTLKSVTELAQANADEFETHCLVWVYEPEGNHTETTYERCPHVDCVGGNWIQCPLYRTIIKYYEPRHRTCYVWDFNKNTYIEHSEWDENLVWTQCIPCPNGHPCD